MAHFGAKRTLTSAQLGYDLAHRRLTIDEGEAAIVRRIFERYRQLKSVGLLAGKLENEGVRSKRRVYRGG